MAGALRSLVSHDRFRRVRDGRPEGRDRVTRPVETVTRMTPFAALPEFLSPEEFRQYLGLARSTVYDLLRRNQIPHVKVGRGIRIPKSALRCDPPEER